MLKKRLLNNLFFDKIALYSFSGVSIMRTFNKELCEAVQAYIDSYRYPPSNFSRTVEIDSITYTYMAEVEPHKDEPIEYMSTETEWTIKFFAAKKNFFFIYELNGQQFCIEPELGVEYTFNFRKHHAFLQKKNIKHFEDHDRWVGFEPKKELACIFQFIEKK